MKSSKIELLPSEKQPREGQQQMGIEGVAWCSGDHPPIASHLLPSPFPLLVMSLEPDGHKIVQKV
jgi:hypothetical protein